VLTQNPYLPGTDVQTLYRCTAEHAFRQLVKAMT